jgi:transcription elongation factor Elf1
MPVPIFQARVSNLDPAFTVTVCCYGCDHEAEVPCREIIARLPGHIRLKDLNRHFRCENCGLKGQVVVDARRALGNP